MLFNDFKKPKRLSDKALSKIRYYYLTPEYHTFIYSHLNSSYKLPHISVSSFVNGTFHNQKGFRLSFKQEKFAENNFILMYDKNLTPFYYSKRKFEFKHKYQYNVFVETNGKLEDFLCDTKSYYPHRNLVVQRNKVFSVRNTDFNKDITFLKYDDIQIKSYKKSKNYLNYRDYKKPVLLVDNYNCDYTQISNNNKFILRPNNIRYPVITDLRKLEYIHSIQKTLNKVFYTYSKEFCDFLKSYNVIYRIKTLKYFDEFKKTHTEGPLIIIDFKDIHKDFKLEKQYNPEVSNFRNTAKECLDFISQYAFSYNSSPVFLIQKKILSDKASSNVELQEILNNLKIWKNVSQRRKGENKPTYKQVQSLKLGNPDYLNQAMNSLCTLLRNDFSVEESINKILEYYKQAKIFQIRKLTKEILLKTYEKRIEPIFHRALEVLSKNKNNIKFLIKRKLGVLNPLYQCFVIQNP